ncbi:hypothetical protein [Lactococcus petauri]|nr:hypothetical protein [Lactococcus petauri]MDC0825476.1 hypothetical protein [Lactococcus petauri]
MTPEKRKEVVEAAANFVIKELNKENEKSPAMVTAIAELISKFINS